MRYTICRRRVLGARVFPSLERRGGCAAKKSCEATIARADGVVAHTKCSAELTTPSAPLRWLRSIFLMAQPPLLSEEGSTLLPTCGLLVMICISILTTACTQNMATQPRYDPLEASDFFPDSSSARPLPIGTISRDYVMKIEFGETGMIDGKPADRFPFPITAEVLRRGQQRYNIYCSPCHDYVGTGNGMAARRGFRRMPASFHTDEMRMSPPGHFFDVMTNGFGSMPPYASQIAARDRWAITAYIRALQLSQWATLDSVPEDERRRLEQERR